MTVNSPRDDLDDVSDSTDWLTTPLKQLYDVESSLRCQVCKDFFKTPMITSCSHTFCSLCIRRCLVSDGKCPACRAPEQELKLRANAIVGGIVETFQRARPIVLDFARNPSKTAHPSLKRKLEAQVSGDERGQTQVKRTRCSNRISSMHRGSSEVVDVEEGSDEDYQSEDFDLVACPICDTRMKIETINLHLDRCTGQSPRPSTTRTTFASSVSHKSMKPVERLPQLSYGLFKDAALRKKLMELGISAAGNRPLLERRHTEWVTLWNANFDSSRPRRKAELLHDLEVWERSQGSRALNTNSLGMNFEIRSKDFDNAGWSARHGDSFRSLIEVARRKVATKEGSQLSLPRADGQTGNYSNLGAPENEETSGSSKIPIISSQGHSPAIEKSSVDSLTVQSPPRIMEIVEREENVISDHGFRPHMSTPKLASPQ